MERRSVLHMIPLILFVAGIIAAYATFRGTPTAWLTGLGGRVLSPVTRMTMRIRAVATAAIGRYDLAQENILLRQQLERSRADAAMDDELRRQLAFYRTVSGIRDRLGNQPLVGSVSSYVRDAGLRDVVINRGAHDGVTVGDIVVSAGGALIGLVREVFDGYASVRMVGDPALEFASRIVGTEISGLVRTDHDRGIVLDFVQKNEQVSEGQSVVTVGSDRFPGGLLVGTVRSVDNDATTLFKVVRMTSAIADDFSGDIIIMKP